MSKKLVDIEGIGETFAAKLKDAGVTTQDKLLEWGADTKGRKALAEKSGVSEKHILNWVNRADLARVKGIGEEYADLLEHTGVDTVPELARRNVQNLFTAMMEVNTKKNLCQKAPTENQLEDWVGQAKKLPRVVNY